MKWWRRFRLWLDPPPPTPPIDTGEVCRTCVILDEASGDLRPETLAADDCWEWGEELPNEPEMGRQGGSWVSGYWCTNHKPEGAWPWAP